MSSDAMSAASVVFPDWRGSEIRTKRVSESELSIFVLANLEYILTHAIFDQLKVNRRLIENELLLG